MPGGRKGRGGSRTGTPGKSYPQRTDLGGKVPMAAAGGQGYGEAKAQMDSQRAVPMAGAPAGPAPSGWDPSQGRPEGMAKPGSMGDLFADSEDPNEHVMNGAALGPGLGPEAFGGGVDAMRQEDLKALAPWIPMIQDQVNRTGGSPYTRAWLRTVMGAGAGDLWT